MDKTLVAHLTAARHDAHLSRRLLALTPAARAGLARGVVFYARVRARRGGALAHGWLRLAAEYSPYVGL